MKAILRYSVFADVDAVIRGVLLENTGSEPLYIERALSACMDLDDESFEMLTLTGSWAVISIQLLTLTSRNQNFAKMRKISLLSA